MSEIMTARPTKEAQDQFFKENGLDPWGYDNPFVRARLDKSLKFIQRFVGADFDGSFVEIGAFNGDFTRRLVAAFPLANIIASDIVKAPWEAAFIQKPLSGKVSFHWCDMADFEMPSPVPSPAILLLMECLYYLPRDQRSDAVRSLADKTKANAVFVSGPIYGPDNYFSEKFIAETFGRHWPHSLGSAILTPFGTMAAMRRAYRDAVGKPPTQRQVIYGFSRLAS